MREDNSKLNKLIYATRAQLSLPLYVNTFYLILGSIATSLLGFVFWVVVARFYTTADVGLAAALIAAVGVLASLSNLGFGIGIIRYLPEAKDKTVPMINSAFTITSLASLVIALIFLAGLQIWSPRLLAIQKQPVYIVSFVFFTVAFTLVTVLNQVFVAKRCAKYAFIHNMISGALKVPLPIIFAAFFGALGIFVSAWIAVSVALLVGILWLLRRIEKGYIPLPTVHRTIVSEIAHYSLGNHFANLLWNISSLLLPILVINVLGAEMNAYFFIAWAIASVLFMMPSAVSMSLFAEGSHERNLLRANVLKSLKLLLPVVVLAILLIFAVGDKLLLLFGSAYSRSATTLLWVLALSTLPLVVNSIFLGVKRVQKDISSIMIASVGIAAGTLGSSYFLMKEIGILGVGIGWLAGQTVIALVVGSVFSLKLFRRR